MTAPCAEVPCPNSTQIRVLSDNDAEQSRKIDKILAILTDSTLDGGSVVDRLRKHDAQINELKSVPAPVKSSYWDAIKLKSIETVTQAVWAALFLFVTKGFIAEILSKGQP